jgi:hypothetical protein
MKQFLKGTDQAFLDLETNAKASCVRFRNQELPHNCIPSQGDIGFEVDSSSGIAKLFVNKGIIYTGNSTEISLWLNQGVKEFQSFDLLKQWIRGPLTQAFQDLPKSAAAQPSQLTDISAIHDSVNRTTKSSLFLDETDIFARLQKKIKGQVSALHVLSNMVANHCARSKPARPAVAFAVGPSGEIGRAHV